MDDKLFNSFSKLVHQLTGITIDPSRRSMLDSRLGSRMRQTGIADYEAYYKLVLGDEKERRFFIDKITTHETSFFRTARVWEYLENCFIPEWLATHPDDTCKLWSAACSTGEEAYSLAITMEEVVKENPSFRYTIDATDISECSVNRCREGLYKQRAVKRFSQNQPVLFSNYIDASGKDYQVSRLLRSKVNFSAHNLFKPLSNSVSYDLVLLRNVLIYFSVDDQKRVLANLRNSMREGSVLIIGESESIGNLDCGFEGVQALVYSNSCTPARLVAANG